VGSAATVSVGSSTFEESNAKVVLGTCPSAREIRVDDALVGKVGASTIVDAKGGHCYEVMSNGFPGARLEGARTYEAPLDLFLPAEAPTDKTVVRRCSLPFAAIASHVPQAATTYVLAKPPPKPPRKPRK
jgi:hypothetical protein